MPIDLTSGIVQIFRDDDVSVGTGFLVSESGLIATCAHVVKEAKAGPGNKLKVRFQKNEEKYDVLVSQEWWRSQDYEDVAILKLENKIPKGIKVLPLGSSEGVEYHKVKTFGFPYLGSIHGLWGIGTIYGKVTDRKNILLQIDSKEITSGFSGAPLLDEYTNRVIGIIVSIVKKDSFDKLQNTAFAIPSETLRLICSELEIKDICPYRGLLSFTEEDQEFFFGRDKLVQELTEKLRSNPRFLAVVGSSGRGKSSVVSAGLLPRIRKGDIPGLQNAQIITFLPGIKPNESLEKALDSILNIEKSDVIWDELYSCFQKEDNKSLVIFVDQFEELFIISEENERNQFIKNLNNLLKSQLKVSLILTIRADFIEFLTDSIFEKYFNQGNVPVKRMYEDELREAIIKPAKEVGLEIETGLEDSLIEDLRNTKDPLPLLEFTLTKLWEYRSEGQLTHESYRKLGGVTGAIGHWAGEAYDILSDEEKELSKRIFTRLIHYGENGTKDSRCRLSLAELTAESEDREIVRKLITKLADARLLVTDREQTTEVETVEIVHDSLISNWIRLKEWISEDQNFLLWRQRLDIKIYEWRAGRESLLKDAALIEAKKWSEEYRQELNQREKEYIQVSLKSKEREDRELKEKEERELKRELEFREKELLTKNRRKKEIIKGLSIFSILTLLLAGVAVQQKALAEERKEESLARYLASKSEILQKDSENLDTSILLAIESFRIHRTVDADRLIHNALLLRHVAVFMEHNGPVNSVTFSPDGKYIASASEDNKVKVWDVSTGSQIRVMKHDGPVYKVVFSPNVKNIATISDDNEVRVWDVNTETEICVMRHEGIVNDIALSPDGKYIASASMDNTTRVWDITGKQLCVMKHDGPVSDVEFSPNGKNIAATNGPDYEKVTIWDIFTGTQICVMKHDESIDDVAFSLDGKYIVTASDDDTARVWDAFSGTQICVMKHETRIFDVTFSPDGKYIATASWDNTARIWNATIGTEKCVMKHDRLVQSVDFSPDGKYVATASEDNTARIWDATTGEEISVIRHPMYVYYVVFSPNGKYIATVSEDNIARVWDVEGEARVIRHEGTVYDIAFSPDGKYIATASDDDTARVWDTATGKQLCAMKHDGNVYDIAFSPDGKYIATASEDTTAKVWNAATGTEICAIKHNDNVNSVAFSPDGKYVATTSLDSAKIWNATIGTEICILKHDDYVDNIAFSPDGKYVATASYDNTARIWDAITGTQICIMKHDDTIESMAFSPDGKYIATASSDTTAKVWNAITGTQICAIKTNGFVHEIAFSPDGKYVATANCDTTARLFDAATGEEIFVMKHDVVCVSGIAFSPDGKYIATINENTARLWDAATREEIFVMKHDNYVNSIAFSPDGKYIATASGDTVNIWICKTEDIINELGTCLTNNLTPEEWKKYMGNEPYHKTFANLP